MKKLTSLVIAALLFVPASVNAKADDPNWRPKNVMYCSDGEFDWDSGQSLYDFVILTRGPDDFIVSYLGIPHPSFEERPFKHLWMKMIGVFSSSYQETADTRTYTLKLALENEPVREAKLVIGSDDYYKFTMEPSLSRPITKSGLCWDSLKPEPRELQNKRR